MKKRSKKLIIYSVSLLIFSIFSSLMGFIAAISSGKPDLILRGLVFFTPIALLISSVSLLMLWNWARYLYIVSASILSLMLSVMFFLNIGELLKDPSFFLIILAILYFLISAIRYFISKEAKEQFKQT